MNETDQFDSILNRVCIAMPCNIGWDNMKGNDEVRLCGGCNKNVYNISAMSKKRAEEILSAPELPCVSIVRKEDGTLVTDECPKWLRPFRNAIQIFTKSAIAAIAVLYFLPVAQANEKRSCASKPKERNTPLTRIIYSNKPPNIVGIAMAPRPKGRFGYIETLVQIVWPAEIAALGFEKEDLPHLHSGNVKQLEKVDPNNIVLDSTGKETEFLALNKTAWIFVEEGRKSHASACVLLKQLRADDCLKACAEAREKYDVALGEISKGSHDKAFNDFVLEEVAKLDQMKELANSVKNSKLKSAKQKSL